MRTLPVPRPPDNCKNTQNFGKHTGNALMSLTERFVNRPWTSSRFGLVGLPRMPAHNTICRTKGSTLIGHSETEPSRIRSQHRDAETPHQALQFATQEGKRRRDE